LRLAIIFGILCRMSEELPEKPIIALERTPMPKQPDSGRWQLWGGLGLAVISLVLPAVVPAIPLGVARSVYTVAVFLITWSTWKYAMPHLHLLLRLFVVSLIIIFLLGLEVYGMYTQYRRDHPLSIESDSTAQLGAQPLQSPDITADWTREEKQEWERATHAFGRAGALRDTRDLPGAIEAYETFYVHAFWPAMKHPECRSLVTHHLVNLAQAYESMGQRDHANAAWAAQKAIDDNITKSIHGYREYPAELKPAFDLYEKLSFERNKPTEPAQLAQTVQYLSRCSDLKIRANNLADYIDEKLNQWPTNGEMEVQGRAFFAFGTVFKKQIAQIRDDFIGCGQHSDVLEWFALEEAWQSYPPSGLTGQYSASGSIPDSLRNISLTIRQLAGNLKE
jgi:hypothetical protein